MCPTDGIDLEDVEDEVPLFPSGVIVCLVENSPFRRLLVELQTDLGANHRDWNFKFQSVGIGLENQASNIYARLRQQLYDGECRAHTTSPTITPLTIYFVPSDLYPYSNYPLLSEWNNQSSCSLYISVDVLY